MFVLRSGPGGPAPLNPLTPLTPTTMEKQEQPYLNPNDLADFCADSFREMGCKLPEEIKDEKSFICTAADCPNRLPTAPAEEDMWAKPAPAPDDDKEAASEKMRLYDIRQRWLYRRYDIAREMLPTTMRCYLQHDPDGKEPWKDIVDRSALLAVKAADALIKQLRKEDDE